MNRKVVNGGAEFYAATPREGEAQVRKLRRGVTMEISLQIARKVRLRQSVRGLPSCKVAEGTHITQGR